MIWPSTLPKEPVGGHKRQVDRVEHHLHRQQQRNDVATEEDAGRANGEQHRREHQIRVERGLGHHGFGLACGVRPTDAAAPFAPARWLRPWPPESAPTSPRTRRSSPETAALPMSYTDVGSCTASVGSATPRRRCSAQASSTTSTTESTAPNRRGPAVRMRRASGLRRLGRHVEQHDDEQKQHHDGAGVDDDLHRGHERGPEQDVESRQRTERHDQQHARCAWGCAAPRRAPTPQRRRRRRPKRKVRPSCPA